jgi:hypothetical protein
VAEEKRYTVIMRVLLINKFHYLKGGAERAYFDTAHILAENGHSVAFFAMEHPDNFETPWSRFFVSGVDYHDAAAGLWSKLRAALRILWNSEAATKLDALIGEFKPEVAHLHNTYHQLSPSILWTLRKHGVRIVMTLHDYKLISPNYSLLVCLSTLLQRVRLTILMVSKKTLSLVALFRLVRGTTRSKEQSKNIKNSSDKCWSCFLFKMHLVRAVKGRKCYIAEFARQCYTRYKLSFKSNV